MSKVSFKIPVFMTINSKKICYLIDYHRYVELRALGLKDSQIVNDYIVSNKAA